MSRSFVLAFLFLAGCSCSSASPHVVVQLVTDYVPGSDFDGIRVAIGDRTETVAAYVDRSYGRATRVTELDLTSSESALMTVALLDGTSVVQMQPRRVVPLATGVTVVTVLITRDCEGVMCPGAGDAAAIACVGGRCINPACTPETPDLCPACEGTCAPSAVACVDTTCRPEGVCFDAPDDTLCEEGEFCAAEDGCIPGVIVPTDGGGIDAGRDAGIDGGEVDAGDIDAGDLDAGEDIDAGPPDTGTDAGPVLLTEDCTHRWVGTTDIASNLKLFASDVTALVAGFAGSIRTDGLDETDGHVVWTLPSTGPWAGASSDQVALLQNGAGGASLFGVLDMRTGASIGSMGHYYFTSGWALALTVSPLGDSLIAESTMGAGMYEVDVGAGTNLTGAGPMTMLVEHQSSGAYRTHAIIASAATSLPMLRPAEGGRWAIAVSGQSAPVTLGSHVVAVGAHEAVVVTDMFAFVDAFVAPGPIRALATIPGANVRAIFADGAGTIAFTNDGERWRRPDCTGSLLLASDSRFYVVAQANPGPFCGATIPEGAFGVAVAALDETTGDTTSIEWFSSNLGFATAAVSPDDDVYVAVPITSNVCGDTGSGTGHTIVAL